MPTKKNKQVGKSVEPERHDCTECQFLTNLPWKLRVHIDRVHRKKHRYMCTDCDYGCYEKLVMEKHMKMHNRAEPGPFPCPKCSFCTCRQSNLDYHLTHQHKDGHPIRKLKCSKCPKVCADQIDLDVHMAGAHRCGSSAQCEECGQSFATELEYIAHTAIHDASPSVIKTIECGRCDASLSAQKQLLRHMEEAHREPMGGKFVCPSCGVRFRFQMYLERHIREITTTSTHPTLPPL